MLKKVALTQSYILHHRQYSESSLILDVFSREHGRVNLIAKGARKNKKQQHLGFNLYQPYLLSWTAKTELFTLTDIEMDKMLISLRPQQLLSGFYMNELVIHLLHKHEAHPELYDSYQDTLLALNENQQEQLVLRYFEKSLLQSLGYGLVLDVDTSSGEPINPDQQYCYEYDNGPTISTQKNKSHASQTIMGKTLLELESEQLQDPKNINEAKQLLRNILSNHLGDKKLASRELYGAYIKVGANL